MYLTTLNVLTREYMIKMYNIKKNYIRSFLLKLNKDDDKITSEDKKVGSNKNF